MPPESDQLWVFLPLGYLLTIAIETPILLCGLSRRHPASDRLIAGLWLTACTYPIVVLVLPYLVWGPYGRGAYLLVAETFAPVAECGLFWAVYIAGNSASSRQATRRDLTMIVVANLASFLLGLLLF